MVQKKRDVVKLYREISGQSYLIVFDDVVKRYHAKHYQYDKPRKGVYMPCETIPIAQVQDIITRFSEYVGDLIVMSEYGQRGYSKIDFIIIHIANKSYKLEKYIEDIIHELSDSHYSIQMMPMIKLGYMGVNMDSADI